jgi:hypothetical protein
MTTPATKIPRLVGILILILGGFVGIMFLSYSWHITDKQDTILNCSQAQVEHLK